MADEPLYSERLVEGLAARVALQVLARDIPGGRAISQPTDCPVSIASHGRLAFAWTAFTTIRRSSADAVLVQGHGVAALAANLAARTRRVPCWMLICSPAAEYYEARRASGEPFVPAELAFDGPDVVERGLDLDDEHRAGASVEREQIDPAPPASIDDGDLPGDIEPSGDEPPMGVPRASSVQEVPLRGAADEDGAVPEELESGVERVTHAGTHGLGRRARSLNPSNVL